MRIGYLSLLLCALAMSAQAQVTPNFQGYTPLKSETELREPRLQRGRQVQNLRTAQGLSRHLFARRIGEISAITGHETTLYAADKTRGIIYKVDDRNGDGISDGPRPLPQRFDVPTGLAMVSGTLYVADRNAVWRMTASGSPAIIAGLKNINSTGEHILRAGDGYLWLGLSTDDGTAKLLRIALPGGNASLAEEMPGQMLDLSHDIGGRPWMVVDSGGQKSIGPSSDFMTDIGRDASQIWVPMSAPQNWPAKLRQHIFISRPIAGDVVALPAMINRPVAAGKPVLSGFTSQNGRAIWGQISAIYQDTRGLFLADGINGDIWLIAAEPSKPAVQITPEKADTLATPEPPQSSAPKTLPIESGISRASTLTEGSQLKQGSTIDRASTIEITKPKKDDPED